MGKALVVIYLFHSNSFSINSIFALNKEKNDILNTIFMLVLNTRKVFLKN